MTARPARRRATRADRERERSIQGAAAAVSRSKSELIKAARKDPAVFCQYVLRDESNGRRIKLVDMHCEWHDVLSHHRRAVLWTFTDAGKTQQISVGRVLWEIGKNPAIRVLIVCESSDLGKKIIESIKRYIEQSVELAEVFPHLKRGVLWTQNKITVKRDIVSKDPTVQAVGYRGRIMGSRVDLILIDDYLSPENTSTETQRKNSLSWLKSTIEGRKAPGARLWFIGNAWHARDAMHVYAKEPGMAWRRFGVTDEAGRPRWEARWPLLRIVEERQSRGPVEGPRSLDCQAADETTQWFPIGDLWPALIAGDGLDTIYALERVPSGYHTITAIDLGVKQTDTADPTAVVSIIVDPRGRRRLLWVDAGHWRGSQIVDLALDHHRRYSSIVWVETNGAQDFLRQQLAEKPLWDPNDPGKRYVVPVRSFVTGKNRVDPRFGIQSIAAEMSNRGWQIPNRGAAGFDAASNNLISVQMHKEVRELIGEMLAWSPESHTGDRLQALWIAREASRMLGMVETGTKPRNT